MKRTLPLALAAMVTLLGATASNGADIPIVKFVPDVILGDSNPGQTASSGYYIYEGLDISAYVEDEDSTPAVSFLVPDAGRNVSISGKSELTASGFSTWEQSGSISSHKNVDVEGGNEVIRATSELWSVTGPTPVTGDGTGLYGETAVPVELLVADGANTGTGTFWVYTSSGAASTTDAEVIYSETIGYINHKDQNDKGWHSEIIVGTVPYGTGPLVFSDQVTTSSSTDYVTVDCRNVPATEYGMGSWINTHYTVGPDWIDGLVRASWTMTTPAADPRTIPELRSRMLPGNIITDPDAQKYQISGLVLNNTGYTNDMVRMANGHQAEYRHYYYDDPALTTELASEDGVLMVGMDCIDYPDSAYFDGVARGERVFIDRLVVEVLPVPDASMVNNVTTLAATDLENMAWAFDYYSVGYTPVGALEAVSGAGAGGVGIRGATYDSATPYTEEMLFGNIVSIDPGTGQSSLGVSMADLEGYLIRIVPTVKFNDATNDAAFNKGSFRIRAYAESFEVVGAIDCPGTYVGATTDPSYVLPGLAGRQYYVYMDCPAVINPSDDLVVALDAMTLYDGGASAYPRMAVNVLMTDLQIDTVLKD